MAADKREAHVRGHAIRLVNDPSCLHGSSGGYRAEPVNVILNDKQTSRNGHGRQKVVVLRHSRCRLGVCVKTRREPDILAHDLACCLDVGAGLLLCVADAPALQCRTG